MRQSSEAPQQRGGASRSGPRQRLAILSIEREPRRLLPRPPLIDCAPRTTGELPAPPPRVVAAAASSRRPRTSPATFTTDQRPSQAIWSSRRITRRATRPSRSTREASRRRGARATNCICTWQDSPSQVPNFRYRSLKGIDPKALRNRKFSLRWNKGGRPSVDSESDDDDEEEEEA